MIDEKLLKELKGLLVYDPLIGRFNWRFDGKLAESTDPHGYKLIAGLGKGAAPRAHRVAWYFVYGEMPQGDIDHINGDKGDNRIANLRLATRSENNQNKLKAHKNSKTGLLGVAPSKSAGKYRAQIRLNNKQHYLGEFPTPELAHAAYMEAKVKMHRFRDNVPIAA